MKGEYYLRIRAREIKSLQSDHYCQLKVRSQHPVGGPRDREIRGGLLVVLNEVGE